MRGGCWVGHRLNMRFAEWLRESKGFLRTWKKRESKGVLQDCNVQ